MRPAQQAAEYLRSVEPYRRAPASPHERRLYVLETLERGAWEPLREAGRRLHVFTTETHASAALARALREYGAGRVRLTEYGPT